MKAFALVDGNSFYCSCEKAFNPRLRNRPVVVLSNNDGCIIARSAEAKLIGIKMGEPWHHVKKRLGENAVEWFSSNYTLYADMSRRMFDVLCMFSPEVEPYSIDEMFLDLSGQGDDFEALGSRIRQKVLSVTKIPTCVGIGPSKAIAKLANKLAKSDAAMNGVCNMMLRETRERLYPQTPVSEIWGVGRASAEKLNNAGIKTVADFISAPDRAIRDELTVVGLRLQAELRGISCLPLTMIAPPKKGTAVTRSFAFLITDWWHMEEAISSFATRGAEKLRAEGLVASALSVFMRTNPHIPGQKYHGQRGKEIEPTADTFSLVQQAIDLARSIWRPHYKYMKAGIMLDGLMPASAAPHDLFPTRDPEQSRQLMAALDAINQRYGRNTLYLAASGMQRKWVTRAAKVSPRYTTEIRELMLSSVRI